jgi:hypothetical protein
LDILTSDRVYASGILNKTLRAFTGKPTKHGFNVLIQVLRNVPELLAGRGGLGLRVSLRRIRRKTQIRRRSQ